jgi:glycosyltransferase involved in cell wall biosynthesis
VRERLPDLRLTLIGEGPMVSEVRSFAIEHSLQHVLSLPGVVQNRELPSHIRMADIVVSPSIAVDAWAEQVGMVNIQSIACGTPVVTTASGSIPEFIEDGVSGVVVPEKDPSALASAMIRLLTDAQLHCRLSTACRRAAELRYDAFRNVAATEQVLLAALNKRPRGRGPISAPADFSG